MLTAHDRDLDSQGVDSANVRLTQSEERWQTVGSFLADRLSALPEIEMILERFEGDRATVFVVLQDDPEPVLDAIFAAEAELLRRGGQAFDLRVMKPSSSWDAATLRDSSILRFFRS